MNQARKRERMANQLVVRVDDQLMEALQRDAEENGRTVAQSVRFLLSKRILAPATV